MTTIRAHGYPGWIRRCNLGTGDFNNDLTTSDTPGDVWSSSFTGTSVQVIAPKEPAPVRSKFKLTAKPAPRRTCPRAVRAKRSKRCVK